MPAADPRKQGIHSIRQIAPNQLEDLAEFFRTDKSLAGRVTSISGWLDVDAVPPLLERCMAAARAEADALTGDAAAGSPRSREP